jgi:hypothetical protein
MLRVRTTLSSTLRLCQQMRSTAAFRGKADIAQLRPRLSNLTLSGHVCDVTDLPVPTVIADSNCQSIGSRRYPNSQRLGPVEPGRVVDGHGDARQRQPHHSNDLQRREEPWHRPP